MTGWLVVLLLAQADARPDDGATRETPAAPAEAAFVPPPFAGTAYVLPAGRISFGVFAPLRYGLGHELELSSHALLNLLMPNLALQKRWGQLGALQLASRHALYYPTGLLQVLAREGTGGILPWETRVPHILLLGNELRASLPFAGRQLVTGRVGLTLAGAVGRSTLASIDLPLVWPRLAPVFDHATVVLGVDLDGVLAGPLVYFADLDLFLIPNARGPVAVEQTTAIGYRTSERFAVLAGSKLVFGTYPAPGGRRSAWHLLPVADLVWSL